MVERLSGSREMFGRGDGKMCAVDEDELHERELLHVEASTVCTCLSVLLRRR